MDYVVGVILLLVILGGGFFLRLGLRNIWRGVASASWPRVSGTVVRSTTNATTDVNKNTGQRDKMYSADIAFQYNVSGHDYTTTTLHFGQTLGSGGSSDAEIRHLRYPQGATVTIAYNPKDPSIAAAEPGFSLEAFWLVAAGLAFILPCVMAGILVYTTESGRNESRGMAIGAGIFASIFAVLGIAALCAGLTTVWRAKSSVHWPTAEGVIRYANMQTEDKAQRVSDGEGVSHVEHSESYSTNLVFEYEVSGEKYFANVRRFGVLNGDLAQEADAAEKYPLGAKVTVAYSPVNPNVAVLEPGTQGATYAMAGVGAACLFFASVVFIWIIPSMLRF